MTRMFHGAEGFSGDVEKWNVSRVEDIFYMFCRAISFTSTGIDRWGRDISNIFDGAELFDGDIRNWTRLRNANSFNYCVDKRGDIDNTVVIGIASCMHVNIEYYT
jgi:hypothetical protein